MDKTFRNGCGRGGTQRGAHPGFALTFHMGDKLMGAPFKLHERRGLRNGKSNQDKSCFSLNMSSMNGMIYNTISVDGGFDSSSLFIICVYIYSAKQLTFSPIFLSGKYFGLAAFSLLVEHRRQKKTKKKKKRKRRFDSIDTLSTVKEDTKYSECRRLR